MSATIHHSVLLEEVVAALAPRSPGVYIDATLGLGGHAEAILDASGPAGRLLGVDRDPEALVLAEQRLKRFGDRVTLKQSDFSRLVEVAADHIPADGLVADLGVSSLQLDRPERGFSFRQPGPLDMRMGPAVGPTLAELLSRIDLDELTRVLQERGEVSGARRLAKVILAARDRGELRSTRDLAELIEAERGPKRPGAIHPATQVFQALRMAVNRELEELAELLAAIPNLLAPGGRAAIISFHSLEDRAVKDAFRDPPEAPAPRRGLPVAKARSPLQAIHKKVIVPGPAEIERNPRARSAKLRVAERRPE
jgi:16S rRNA (cytosine1402-N4)-methyltransferase